MTVNGTVAEWEGWTGLVFPETGDYVVPGALETVRIDPVRHFVGILGTLFSLVSLVGPVLLLITMIQMLNEMKSVTKT